jgi:peptidoglycan hydrolase CwlO-like protein
LFQLYDYAIAFWLFNKIGEGGRNEMKQKLRRIGKLFLFLLIISITLIPYHASGEVKPITELEEKLDGISAEEKEVLEKLFTITQKMQELENEITRMTVEIGTLQVHIENLEDKIEEKQKDYDDQLEILKQVLISYQRGGPASYLEILLNADNLTQFLKSINMIKDISRNVSELLDSLEEAKNSLQDEKDTLAVNLAALEQKKTELEIPLQEQKQLKLEQEEYLASLKEEREYYSSQLDGIVQVWEDCKLLFADIMEEIKGIVGEGHFTMEDLNLSFSFFHSGGAIYEDTFNNILKEHSDLPETIFHFHEDEVIIEVPQKHLVIKGQFILSGESSVLFEAKEGSFYEMPLEAASMEELFLDGPLMIDFKELAGDMVMIDFTLEKVQTTEGRLEFEISPKF